jgi:hypothetical protein
MLGSMVLLAGGLLLLTNLRADTDRPVLWLWMAITGLGIGPSFAVFTLIVQNAVSPDRIGAATSNLTFFQQIGGTIGLTLAGTIFASRFAEEIPPRLVEAGVPPAFADGFASGGGGAVDLAGTGDLGERILASVPAEQQGFVEPLIPGIVGAIYDAFSIAVASSFWVGIVAALVALVTIVFLPEVAMRDTFEMEGPEAPEATPA